MYVFKQLPTEVVELEAADFEQEAYLEGFLIEHKELLSFSEDDEPKIEILGRQFTFKDSKDRIDLLAMELDERVPYLRIVELKRDIADKRALEQLNGYINTFKNEWQNILRQWELDIDINKKLDEWRVQKNNVKVTGIIAAPSIEEDVRKQLSTENIQGIEIKRFQTQNKNEAFIFVDYYPPAKKWVKVEISSEEFWKTHNTDKKVKERINQLLDKLKALDLYVKYWPSGSIRGYVDGNDRDSIIPVFTPKQNGFNIEIRKRNENGKRVYDRSLSDRNNDDDIIKKIIEVKDSIINKKVSR